MNPGFEQNPVQRRALSPTSRRVPAPPALKRGACGLFFFFLLPRLLNLSEDGPRNRLTELNSDAIGIGYVCQLRLA